MIPKFDPWSALDAASAGAKAAKPAKPAREVSRFSTISTANTGPAEPQALAPTGIVTAPEPERWRTEIKDLAARVSSSVFVTRVIADARQFLDSGWAHQAAALGWDDLSLFGVHPRAPEARLDCRGLVVALAGRRIIALSDMSASIEAGGGAILTHYRRTKNTYGEAIPIWELDLS